MTLVLSREARAGHEQAFEDVLHRLAAEVGRQPGHLDVTVLRPPPGGRRIYTIVSHFASRADADAWLASEARARLVAEAGLHSAGELHTRYVSGLEGWLAAPGAPVLVPPARWKTALVSAAGILPLLEAVSYLFAPRLAGLAVGPAAGVGGDCHSVDAVRGDAGADPGCPPVPVPGPGRPAAGRCVMSESPPSLQGKAALVTGAATGIEASGGTALALAADISNRAEYQAMVEEMLGEYGRWDVLVNNAAVAITRPFAQITEAEFDLSFAVNVKGVFHQGSGKVA